MSLWTNDATPGTPYWWADVDWPDLDVEPPKDTDVLIIGAGYTGLSAAIAASDAGASVAVLDSVQPGQGASTRNGGMFGAHPRLPWDAVCKLFGRETADGIFSEAHTALEFAKSLIEREGIDCDLQQVGRIQLAWSKAHFEAQKRLAEVIKAKSKAAVRIVERAELGAEIDTEKYFGGIVFPEHCGIHPAKFHRGLLKAALERDIRVCAPVEALSIERTGDSFDIQTSAGVVSARHLILATNGYTPKRFNWNARRVFPLPSYIIATEPLGANRVKALAPAGRMMVETRARQSYFRPSPDGTRILYGGRASIVNIPLDLAARRIHQTMSEVWPELKNTRLSHVWTGNTGYSFTHMPQVGEAGGVHFAMGYSGSGTVLAPYLGAKAAWRALGDPRGETAYADTKMPSRWFYTGGAPHFLHAADTWYRHIVDRVETRAGRR